MNYHKLCFLLWTCFPSVILWAQVPEAQWAINNYNRYYYQAKNVKSHKKEEFILSYREVLYRKQELHKLCTKYSFEKMVNLLQDDGRFSDLDDTDVGLSVYNGGASSGGGIVTETFNRLGDISAIFKN